MTIVVINLIFLFLINLGIAFFNYKKKEYGIVIFSMFVAGFILGVIITMLRYLYL